jgi:hypothetical protein
MADLKPLGSEKLEGMDKIRRILEIAHYNEKPKSQLNENETLNYTIQLADGYTYGIVKEKLGYIIKKGINESVLDYSDPIRQRKYFDSYSQAMKKLNLHAKELNRIHENDEEKPLIGEQTASKKKFVLKTPKPATEPTPDAAPAPAPAPEASPAPAPEETPAPPAPEEGGEPMGGEPMGDEMMGGEPMGGEPMGDEMMGGEPMGGEPMGGEPMGGEPMGGEPMGREPMGGETEEGGGFKTIQRLTGKLSQKLRAYNNQDEDGLDSQDIKYVINMVLSALDLEKLDEDDKEDILSKFEEIDMYGDEGPESLDFSGEEDVNFGGDEFGGEEFGAEPMGGAPMGDEEPTPQEPTENVFGESRVENVLKKYFVVTKEEAPILEEKKQKDYIKNKLTQIKVKQELQNLSETNRQLERANRLLSEGAQFVGKTNLDNLIFNKKGKQIKIDTRGNII